MELVRKYKMRSKNLSCCRKNRKGFVLLSVLILGTVLISCATAFTWFVRIQVRSLGRQRANLEARTMAQLFANNVINLLGEMSNQFKSDNPTQRWFQPFVINMNDLGIWVVQVRPLDDKFPIGNLFLPDKNTLRREFSKPWEEMWDKLGHRELAMPVLDFLDKNERPRVGGVERESYINRPPLDISEMLIMSEDITPEILYGGGGRKGLVDYCTVFSDGRINLNYAPVEVLELLPGLDSGLAARIVSDRKDKPLESLADVQTLPGASPRTAIQLTNLVTFKSRYFELRIESLQTGDMPGGAAFNIIFDRNSRKILRWEES